MVRKLLLCGAFASAMILGTSLPARTASAQQGGSSASQDQKAVKSVSGRIAAIKDQGKAFSLDVSGSETNKKSMDFVLDGNTTVKGDVRQGTTVVVEYQIADNGQNVAVSVTATQA